MASQKSQQNPLVPAHFLDSIAMQFMGHTKSPVWVRFKGSGKTVVTQTILLDSTGHWGHWPSIRKAGPTTVASCTFDILCPLPQVHFCLDSQWLHFQLHEKFMRPLEIFRTQGKRHLKILTLETRQRIAVACVWQFVDNSDFYLDYK